MRRAFSTGLLSLAMLFGTGGFVINPPAAIAQEVNMRVLTVTGQGRESIQTTIAMVTLGVEVTGPTAAAAQQDAAERSTAVVNLLRDRAVDQLQTTGIRLEPQYRYTEGESQLQGYRASNTVSFEMPIDEVGPLLDAAVSAGATQIQGVSFRASEAAQQTARATALQKATADARAQADAVLGALNFTSEEIVGIQINGARQPRPLPQQNRLAVADAAFSEATPVVGGEQTITADVTLQIRY